MKRMLWAVGLVCAVAIATLGAQQFGDLLARRLCIGSALSSCSTIRSGSGSPNSAVTGSIGDLFLRTDGSTATTLYVKESGTATNTGWSAAGGSAFTASSSDVLTNKTLNVESTGNLVTVPFTWWLPGGICNNVTASSPGWSFPTANAAASACATGTNTQIGTLDFADGASILSAETTMRLPADFTGSLAASIFWYASPTTGGVWWELNYACGTASTTADVAYGSGGAGAFTISGTTNRINTSTFNNFNGCSATDVLFIQLRRDPTRVTDTVAGTARVIGIEFKMRRAM